MPQLGVMSTMDHDALVAWTQFSLADARRAVAESRRLCEARRALASVSILVPSSVNLPSYTGDVALQAEVDRVLAKVCHPTKL